MIKKSLHSGHHHWIMQRISALLIIPFVVWFLISCFKLIYNPDYYIQIFFGNFFNVVFTILFILLSIYHGKLGMEVIIEDYIKGKCKRYFCIVLINFISVLTVISTIIVIMSIYFDYSI